MIGQKDAQEGGGKRGTDTGFIKLAPGEIRAVFRRPGRLSGERKSGGFRYRRGDRERNRVKRGEIAAADRQEDRRRTVGQERLSVTDPVASLVAGNRHIFRTLQNGVGSGVSFQRIRGYILHAGLYAGSVDRPDYGVKREDMGGRKRRPFISVPVGL